MIKTAVIAMTAANLSPALHGIRSRTYRAGRVTTGGGDMGRRLMTSSGARSPRVARCSST